MRKTIPLFTTPQPIQKYWPFIYRDGRYVFLRGCRTKAGARKLLVGKESPKGIMINE